MRGRFRLEENEISRTLNRSVVDSGDALNSGKLRGLYWRLRGSRWLDRLDDRLGLRLNTVVDRLGLRLNRVVDDDDGVFNAAGINGVVASGKSTLDLVDWVVAAAGEARSPSES
jgi:hypothetical protein